MPNQEIKTQIVQGLRKKSDKELLDIYLFCPDIEKWTWQTLVRQLGGKRVFGEVKEKELGVSFTAYPELAVVNSKVGEFDFNDNQNFVTRRGLVLDGDWAGWLGWVDNDRVRLQRPLAKFGPGLNRDNIVQALAEQSVKVDEFPEIWKKLEGKFFSFSSIMTALLKVNGFSVDEKKFKANINQFNLQVK